jgi:hypothetical protein
MALRYQVRVRRWLALSQRAILRSEAMGEVRELPLRREVVSEVRELIDTELDLVCGGVSDLGKYITKAVDDAISAAIGGNPGAPAHN